MNCSKCGKKIWFWQNKWSLSDPHKKPHNSWHTSCAKPLSTVMGSWMHIDDVNRYLKSITKFTESEK